MQRGEVQVQKCKSASAMPTRLVRRAPTRGADALPMVDKASGHVNIQALKDAEVAETEALKAELTKFLKELGRYSVWVLAITMISMVTRNSISIYFTNQVIKDSIQSVLASDAQSNNLVSIWGTLSRISGFFLTSSFFVADNTVAKVYDNNYDTFGNLRIGDVMLRQVRVKSASCPSLVSDAGSNCSPDFTYFEEAKEFLKPWESNWSPPTSRQSEFGYQSAQQLNEWFAFPGKNAIYPGDGFAATLSSADQANTTLSDLRALNWIDALTRAVFLDVISYNPHIDIFIQSRSLFEIYPSGQFELTVYNRVIDLSFYPAKPKLMDIISIGLQGIVLGLLVYYTKEEATAIYKEGASLYFSQIWNTFDVINIVLIICLCVIRCILVSKSTAVLANLKQAKPSEVGSIMLLADNENMLMGIVSLLMWFKMLKYFATHKPLGKLGRSVAFVVADLLALCVILFCCVFGFAVGLNMIAGSDVSRFSTMSISMAAHVGSLFGAYFTDAYDQLATKSYTGAAMFWLWMILSQVILLNVIIAILNYGLIEVFEEDERDKRRNIFSVVKELDVVKKVMTVMQSQEEALAQMEAALEMADENDDGLIDEKELKAFLSSNVDASAMFEIQDEKEMMKMFDQDGSGTLDAEEMGNQHVCMDAGLGCSSRFTTGELRKFLGRKKIEMDQKMADPGSLNLASKGGTVTLDTMKLLGISAGAFKNNSVSAAISAKAIEALVPLWNGIHFM